MGGVGASCPNGSLSGGSAAAQAIEASAESSTASAKHRVIFIVFQFLFLAL
jgi:hypothetical protein